MIRYVLGPDNMPVIYPYPKNCIWTGKVFSYSNEITLFAEPFFKAEAEMFQIIAQEQGVSVRVVLNDMAIVKVKRTTVLEQDAYSLTIDEGCAQIEAATSDGIWCGMMSLLQLIQHAPGHYLTGVKIKDWPVNKVRSVTLAENSPLLHVPDILGSFLARYKIDEVNISGKMDCERLRKTLEKYHVALKCIEKETSCEHHLGMSLWKAGEAWCGEEWLPDYYLQLKNSTIRIVAQLRNLEQRKLNESVRETEIDLHHYALDLKKYYNAPLYRLQWNVDDLDFRYLEDAGPVPGSVPFSLLQGVTDSRTDMSLVLAGNGMNSGVLDIAVADEACAISFLHARIAGKSLREKNLKKERYTGRYRLRYTDGSSVSFDIVDGLDIAWGDFSASLDGVHDADIAYAGFTRFHQRYVLYARTWENPYPEKQIRSIDILSDEKNPDSGIAVFGITLLKKGKGCYDEK